MLVTRGMTVRDDYERQEILGGSQDLCDLGALH